MKNSIWTTEEIIKLRKLWPTVLSDDDLAGEFKNRSVKAIGLKVCRLGLSKNKKTLLKKRALHAARQSEINKTILGRDLSFDNLKYIASKYTNRSIFARMDPSAYTTARRKNILGDICSHMTVNKNYNFPQTFLFHLVCGIFQDNAVRFNDRTAIYPKEIDVYLPEIKLGFEYDGKNFHKDASKDKFKDELCESKNITLVRIKEMCKSNPIPSIVTQLRATIKIDISENHIKNAKEKTLNSFMPIEQLKLICLNYDSFTIFRKNEPEAVKLLIKNNMLELHTNHMKRRYLSLDEKCIKITTALGKVQTKTEFYSQFKSEYSCLMKNKETFPSLNQLYSQLK